MELKSVADSDRKYGTTLLRNRAKKYNYIAEWSYEIQLWYGMELKNTTVLRTDAKKYNSVVEFKCFSFGSGSQIIILIVGLSGKLKLATKKLYKL